MTYCKYDPNKRTFSFYTQNGDRCIPSLEESPEYYLIGEEKYFSESGLKRQGLKSRHILSLGEPEYLAPNRRYPGQNQTRLHSESKVSIKFPF